LTTTDYGICNIGVDTIFSMFRKLASQ